MFLSACTSLQHIEMSPQELQTAIISKDLIKVGETVRLKTTDGKIHEFKVTQVSSTHLLGKSKNIAIADIASLDKKNISGSRKGLIIGSIAVMAVFVIVVLNDLEDNLEKAFEIK